jgi:hypothetical protein
MPTVGSGLRTTKFEIGTEPARSAPELVERRQRPPVLGQAQPDVDASSRCRPVLAELQPVRHQLHHGSDRGRADAVLRRLGAIDLERPVDAWRRQTVGNVDDARHLGNTRGNGAGLVVEPLRVDSRKPDLDRLAGWRPCFRHPDLDIDAGNAGHDAAQLSQDLVRRFALAPVDEFILDDADHIFRDILAAALRLADAGIDRLHPRPA